MCDDIDILNSFLDSSSDESNDSFSKILLCDNDPVTDSVEEKLLAYFAETPKRKCIRNYVETIPSYNEQEFMQRFRIGKGLYERLCKDFQFSPVYQKMRADKRSSVELHLTVFLWFAGHQTGSFRDLSDLFNLSTSTVSRLIDRTIEYLSTLTGSTIKWPSKERMKETSSVFQTKTGFPNVIGAIGCVNVEILPPNKSKNERKAHKSLSLQAICDERRKFFDIFVDFPNPSEENSIFKSSAVRSKLEETCGDYHIVGDSTYPCTKNLLTPYCDDGHLTEEQSAYNSKLDSCRIAVTHTLRLLKRRFPQLNYCKLRGLNKLTDFVKSCCILHNLADESDLDYAKEPSPTEDLEKFAVSKGNSQGNVFRDEICKQLQNTV